MNLWTARQWLHVILGLVLWGVGSASLFAQARGISAAAAEGPRLALVIGNNDYQAAGVLNNPRNDAVLIDSTLQQLGFETRLVLDADRRTMERAIVEFGRSLGPESVGVFFYAGHGVQVRGENYLIPVDANPIAENDLVYEAVPLGRLFNRLDDAGNGLNFVILDACRNNPFNRSFRSSSRGLAQVTAPNGTFISYATAPGSVAADGEGANSLFSTALAQHLQTPGIKAEEVFKLVRSDVQSGSRGRQTPWDSSSLTGNFYFAQASPPPEAPAESAGSSQAPAQRRFNADEEAWDQIKTTEDPEVLRAFVERFPKSPLAETAQLKIQALESRSSPEPLPEPGLQPEPPPPLASAEPSTPVRAGSFKLAGGFWGNSISLNGEDSSGVYVYNNAFTEYLYSSGIGGGLVRYFLTPAVSLDLSLSSTSLSSIEFQDVQDPAPSQDFGPQENPTGWISSFFVNILYNWHGGQDSWMAEDVSLFTGVGLGSMSANYQHEYDTILVGESAERSTITLGGWTWAFGVDYTFSNRLIAMFYFNSLFSGAPGGTRTEDLRAFYNVSGSGSTLVMGVGYLF